MVFLTLDPMRKTDPKKIADSIAIIFPRPEPCKYPRSLPCTIIQPTKIIKRAAIVIQLSLWRYHNRSNSNVKAGATTPRIVVLAIEVSFKAPNQKIKCIANRKPAARISQIFFGLIDSCGRIELYPHNMTLADVIRQNAITAAGTSGKSLAITGDVDMANNPTIRII